MIPVAAGRWLDARAGISQGTIADRVLFALTLGVLALGLVLRSRGMLFGAELPFWLDESLWAVFLETEPLTELFIRPIAFMAITKGLVAVLGTSEWVFRALPWLGGVGLVLLAPALARRLFESNAARFLFVCVLALHPAAIDLAREFKPYALGLTLHVAVLITALDYVAKRRTRDLTLTLGLAITGVLFAQDIIFLYPPLFLTLGFLAYRSGNRGQLRAIVLSACGTIALLLTLFAVIWSKLDKEDEREYWAKKYDVFYLAEAERDSSHAAWLARKTGEVLALPGLRRDHWDGVPANEDAPPRKARVDSWLWIALGLAGTAVLVRRKRPHELLLIWGPLLVLMAFNVAGRWPFGAFRTNLFVLAYVAPLAPFVIEALAPLVAGYLHVVPGAVLVLLPFFGLNKHFHASKESFTTSSYFPDAIERLLSEQSRNYGGERELLALDTRSCASWKYYVRYHPRFAARRDEIESRFMLRCGRSVRKMLMRARNLIEHDERAWGIATGPRQREELATRFRGMGVVSMTRLGDQQVVIGVERR